MKLTKKQAAALGIVEAPKRPRVVMEGDKTGKSLFKALCKSYGLTEPIPEYQFATTRKWRFDWCFPLFKLAIEIEGGAWTQGRHTRGKGFINDMEKYNEAAIMGYKVLRVTPQQIESGEAFTLVKRALGLEEGR